MDLEIETTWMLNMMMTTRMMIMNIVKMKVKKKLLMKMKIDFT